jgi:hypothetical protein
MEVAPVVHKDVVLHRIWYLGYHSCVYLMVSFRLALLQHMRAAEMWQFVTQ